MWSLLLVEQELRDGPNVGNFNQGTLDDLGQKLTAFLDTVEINVVMDFDYAARHKDEAGAREALASLQTSLVKRGLKGFVQYLYWTRGIFGHLGTALGGNGASVSAESDGVSISTEHALLPLETSGLVSQAGMHPLVHVGSFDQSVVQSNVAGVYDKREDALSERPTEQVAVSNVLVPTLVSMSRKFTKKHLPAVSTGGVRMGALIGSSSQRLENLAVKSLVYGQVIDLSLAPASNTTAQWPSGAPDLAPKIVGQHALVKFGEHGAGWTPFAISDPAGKAMPLHSARCTELMKNFAGKVSSKLIDFGSGTYNTPYVDELRFTSDRGADAGQAVFLMPNEDHNGAFRLEDQVCERLACWASQGLNILVKAVGGPTEAANVLSSFGDANLKHVTLSGHGQSTHLQWGQGEAGVLHTQSPLTAPFLKTLQQKLARDGTVVLDACLTAKGSELRPPDEMNAKGFSSTGARNLFEHVKINIGDRKVFAPTRPYTENDYHQAAGIGEGHCLPNFRAHQWADSQGDGFGHIVSALQRWLRAEPMPAQDLPSHA